MKLYTYTTERSLPRMALKGMPVGFPLYGSPVPAAEMASEDDSEKNRAVVLEVNADDLDSIIIVSGERVEDVAQMAREEIEDDPDRPEGKATEAQAEQAYEKVYDSAENLGSIEEMIEKFDVVENAEIIPASKIIVLGVGEVKYSDDLRDEGEAVFEGKPKSLKAYQQPFVTQLLRSIFLPRHKLYGSGKRRSPKMGFISKFFPERNVEVDELPPDVVSGITLVWAGGKTFRRGMRGAFGSEAGDAIAKLVSMRAGQEPGKYLGSGAKGAVYMLGQNRVVKVTMDGNEISAAANLIGVRHPNLSFVHDAFIVADGRKGIGVIVRDSIDTTLDRFDKEAAGELDKIMGEVLASATEKVSAERLQDVDPEVLAKEVELMIELLRSKGCGVDEAVLLDLADAFRALRYYGILGIDFDSKNVGVIKKPKPRVVIFDYGMTKSPSVEVKVVNLSVTRQ